MAIVAIIISGFALAISAWTAWMSTLRPAHLRIDFNFVGVGLVGAKPEAVLVLPLSITNTGAQPENIVDAVLIERDHGVALFSSWVSVKPNSLEAFFKEKRSANEPSPHIEGTKAAFLVPAHSQVLKSIVFQPCPQTQPLLADGATLKYEVILRGSSQEWRSERTVVWPVHTTETVTARGAVLIETDDSLAWRNHIAKEVGAKPIERTNALGRYDF